MNTPYIATTEPHLLLDRPGHTPAQLLLVGDDAERYTGKDKALVSMEPAALTHLARFSEPALMALLLDAALHKNYPLLESFVQTARSSKAPMGPLFEFNKAITVHGVTVPFHPSQTSSLHYATHGDCTYPEIFATALANLGPGFSGTDRPLTRRQTVFLDAVIDLLKDRQENPRVSARMIEQRPLDAFLVHCAGLVHSSQAIGHILAAGAEPRLGDIVRASGGSAKPLERAIVNGNTAAALAIASTVNESARENFASDMAPTKIALAFRRSDNAAEINGFVQLLSDLEPVYGKDLVDVVRCEALTEYLRICHHGHVPWQGDRVSALMPEILGVRFAQAQEKHPLSTNRNLYMDKLYLAPWHALIDQALNASCKPVVVHAIPLLNESHALGISMSPGLGPVGVAVMGAWGKHPEMPRLLEETLDFLSQHIALTMKTGAQADLASLAIAIAENNFPWRVEQLQGLLKHGLTESVTRAIPEFAEHMQGEDGERWSNVARSYQARQVANSLLDEMAEQEKRPAIAP